jgi:uncharacterized membrane protein YgdD (TMEM256/DUF423 family)
VRNWVFLRIGAWSALLAVVAGAFGAHALGARVDVNAMATFRTAALYHFLHALALLGIGAWQVPPLIQVSVQRAAWMLAMGMLLFSGSLYLLVLTGARCWGMLTPVGGLLLCAGWAWLGMATGRLRGRGPSSP